MQGAQTSVHGPRCGRVKTLRSSSQAFSASRWVSESFKSSTRPPQKCQLFSPANLIYFLKFPFLFFKAQRPSILDGKHAYRPLKNHLQSHWVSRSSDRPAAFRCGPASARNLSSCTLGFVF